MYKMGPNEILWHCIMENEQTLILNEAHDGFVGIYYAGQDTVCNIFQAVLWWLTMHLDVHDYCRICGVFQMNGKPL